MAGVVVVVAEVVMMTVIPVHETPAGLESRETKDTKDHRGEKKEKKVLCGK